MSKIYLIFASMFVYDYFNFPPAFQIGMHAQDDWELSMVTCGEGIRTIGDVTKPFDTTEVVIIPPKIPHQWIFDSDVTDADGNVSNITVKFSEQTLKALSVLCPEMQTVVSTFDDYKEPIVFSGNEAAGLRSILKMMKKRDNVNRLPLICEILRLITSDSPGKIFEQYHTFSAAEQKMERIRVYITCNLARHITLEDTAKMMGIGQSGLCGFIKRQTGKTFSEYLNGLKIDRACRMLRDTDCNISEIAYDSGFTSVPYFNRVFTKLKGTTPTAYRKDLLTPDSL